MSAPISLRLDPAVRKILERDAAARGVGLATYLRDLATLRAREVRKAAIRDASRLLGERVRASKRAREFYENVGSSAPDVG
jgi:hypothetical protein